MKTAAATIRMAAVGRRRPPPFIAIPDRAAITHSVLYIVLVLVDFVFMLFDRLPVALFVVVVVNRLLRSTLSLPPWLGKTKNRPPPSMSLRIWGLRQEHRSYLCDIIIFENKFILTITNSPMMLFGAVPTSFN